jgi:DNA invertase Pin-like site-specific DNA recombinase
MTDQVPPAPPLPAAAVLPTRQPGLSERAVLTESVATPVRNSWRYFLYARKSSEPDDRQVLSLPAQKQELLRAFGHLNIIEVIEEAQSAKAPGRPRFEAMLKRLERGEADGLIAWHPDRLARNSVDGGRIIYDLDQGKVRDLKFAQYTFENSPEGKWMLNIIFGQSKYFVDKLSKDVKRGLRQKLEMGWRPGVSPIGYLNNLADSKGTRTIVPDPERFVLVRKMWELMLTGAYSPPRILQIATEEWGLRTVERRRIGGSPLSYSGIYRLFTNPFYYGAFEYGGRLHPGSHEPMITEGEFWQVQKLLGRGGRPRPKTRKDFAYTGLMRCGECGCMITAEEKTKRIKATGELRFYTYYHCTKKKRHLKCAQRCIEVKELERQMEAALMPLSISEEFLNWALKYLKEMHEQERAEDRSRGENVEKAHQGAGKQLDELLDVRLRGLIDDEEFERKRSALLREKNGLKSQMDDPEAKAAQRLELAMRTCCFAHDLMNRFENGSIEEKKIILEKVGSNRLLRDRSLTFEPVAPFSCFAKSSESSNWRSAIEDVRTWCGNAMLSEPENLFPCSDKVHQ